MVPSESDAVAVSVTLAGAYRVAPESATVKDTIGAAFCLTLIETGSELAESPALSVAFAIRL